MVENKIKVLITTSGLGSRLGDLSKYTNKSLVKVGNQAIISHIIDSYPNAEFVITLGYYGDYVKQYLLIAHPEKKFEFVYVEPYSGEGSGLIKSISFAKEYLQQPFVFHVCDTIIEKANYETIVSIDNNWMGCVENENPDLFRTVCVNDNKIIKINEKSEKAYDYAYIGVAGIYDYSMFWEIVDDILIDDNIADSSDCHIFMRMLEHTTFLSNKIDKWYDTGSLENLNYANKQYPQSYTVLDKLEENIYFFDDSVIKFFRDENICLNRVKRAKKLNSLTPDIISYSTNFYKYKLSNGDLLADGVSDETIINLVDWASKKLWKEVKIDEKEFKLICENFYINKTKKRVDLFLSNSKIEDKVEYINDILVPDCETMFDMMDWDNICTTKPVNFHGDFILDNILFNENEFILLDWRQDFGGNIDAGDMYYDLSKMNHNMTLNHEILFNNDFSINVNGDKIYCDVLRSHNMVQSQQTFISFLDKKGIDISKIKILTALIWLNMSPLHSYPLNKFLFYFGKYNLWKEIKQLK